MRNLSSAIYKNAAPLQTLCPASIRINPAVERLAVHTGELIFLRKNRFARKRLASVFRPAARVRRAAFRIRSWFYSGIN